MFVSSFLVFFRQSIILFPRTEFKFVFPSGLHFLV